VKRQPDSVDRVYLDAVTQQLRSAFHNEERNTEPVGPAFIGSLKGAENRGASRPGDAQQDLCW
jgi:hypothetical protein